MHNNTNKFERRSYDPSKKKSFSNYAPNRTNNSRPNFSNKYNNNERFSWNQNNTKKQEPDLPDRNATTFDLSAAMMGMPEKEKQNDSSKDTFKKTAETSSLPRKQSGDNNFYAQNKNYNSDINSQHQTSAGYQQSYPTNQSSSNSRFQNTFTGTDNGRWNNNNNTSKTFSGTSLNRGHVVSGNLNSRYSGNSSNYNSNKGHQVRSRFQGGSTYISNSANNNNNNNNSGYYRSNNSRFDSAYSGKYSSPSNYQRTDYTPNKYNSGFNNYNYYNTSHSNTSNDGLNLDKESQPNTPASGDHVSDSDKKLDANSNIKQDSDDKTPSATRPESNIAISEKQDMPDDDLIEPVLKPKLVVDNDNPDLINDSEMETDAMKTPLKPRHKALSDTVETKVKTELQPSNINIEKHAALSDSKKSLISEIEAEAKYFSSLSGASITKQPITQRQVSIKRDPYGKTKLHFSVNKNDLSSVRKLIEEQGFDPNLQDYAGITALHCACAKGYYKIAEYLVNLQNINLNLTTEDNLETALFEACVKLEVDIVRLLLEHGAKISIQNYEKKNVLVYMNEALEDEEYETEDDKQDLIQIIALLEKYWPIIEHQGKDDQKPQVLKSEEFVEKDENKINDTSRNEDSNNNLLDNEKELEFDVMDIASKYGKEKFYKASCKGDYNYVGQFLQNGGRPDKESFIECCKRGHMDLINLFLALTTMNVNMKIPQSNGKNLLMLCCGRGKFDVVKLLIDSGADCMHLDDDGNDVLYYIKKNKKSGWEKEYEFLSSIISSKGGIQKKKREVSVPISPKRIVKPKSKQNTPKSPLTKANSKVQELNGSVDSNSIDNTATTIKRKFFQLTENDLTDLTETNVPPKIKKQPIIKKVKLGGNDEFQSSLTPPIIGAITNAEVISASEPNDSTGLAVNPLKPVAIKPTSGDVVKNSFSDPIEDMKQQKTKEIFDQMEKYEQIKKEKEQEVLKKQQEEERLIEEEKKNVIKLKEQEFVSLSDNFVCLGLQSITNDNKPIAPTFLSNVGPIYYRLVNNEIYVFNLQLFYIFNGDDILSRVKRSIPVSHYENELNKIWYLYKDLFLLGYKNDKPLMKFFTDEILSADSLDFRFQFETYQKSLLKNIELSWIPFNDILAVIGENHSFDYIVEYLVNNMVEICYYDFNSKNPNKGYDQTDISSDSSDKHIYYKDLPIKLKNRPVLKEIFNEKCLW